MFRAFVAVLVLLVGATAAWAQTPGEEAEDALYRPSPTAPGGDEGSGDTVDAEPGEPAPVLDPVEAWAARESLTFLGTVVMPISVPARYGSADGPAYGAMLGWRRFLDSEPGAVRPFVDVSIGALLAGFSNSSADLSEVSSGAPSTAGKLETQSTYLLAIGRLGIEIWRSADLRVTGWLGAGVGVERRSLDFTADAGPTWDDSYHRSVAAGELGAALEWRLDTVSLELRVSALTLLGDTTPLAAGFGLGAGLGVRW